MLTLSPQTPCSQNFHVYLATACGYTMRHTTKTVHPCHTEQVELLSMIVIS